MTQNDTAGLAPGWWFRARAWVDPDGYHIWLAHDCVSARTITILPWPVWHAVATKNQDGHVVGGVEPSVDCVACGLHTFLDVHPLEPHEPDAIAWAAA